ncbi:MAG: Asp-tRNA(Asn)/Glu-tRNA(Gln) amidotransferase subunit GatA [Candidatus Rokuibacteriota bacterium]|nr:MAG: Asp-tRNA(Asn)/Glu-tRNA(Gln) amidotransferase subunit GatA [Candidatus Rokubacteria bacterium]
MRSAETNELCWLSMADLGRMIATKEVSPVEVVRAHLDRISALDARLRAFITVCADSALQSARASEADLMAGKVAGPLHGVPWAPKDLYSTKGVRTTGGSKILGDSVPAADATVVARLGAAGAIVLGKLNMHEFAYGPEGLNAHYGDARNPWDARAHRITGGSSSGSGAAVAAGLAPGSLGSDTGGSIRIPASLCGITGLKPTYGRVSRAGVLPLAWSMDHVGPMTRTARDCALMLNAIAGYDPADPTTSVLPVPDYTAALRGDVKGLRVGLLCAHFTDVATAEVRAAVEAAAEQLERAGAILDEVNLAGVLHVAAASSAIVASEALAYHAGWMRARPQDYQPDVRERLRMGAFVSGAHYVRAQQLRALVRSEIDDALAKRDVLLAPATPIPAPVLGERETTLGDGTSDVRAALIRLTRPFNYSGHPAAAAPCGFTAGGLPIGLQIVGRPFDEATVLRVVDAYQRLTDWHTRRPSAA